MADLEIRIDGEKLREVINDEPNTLDAIGDVCQGIESRANIYAGDFKSGVWHEYGAKHPPGHGTWHDRGKQYPTKGNTPARYRSNVKRIKGEPTGIVFTANYAAQKDNMQHNTLLKSL